MYNSHHLLVYTVFQIPMYVGSPMPSIKAPLSLIEGPSIYHHLLVSYCMSY